MESNSLLTTKGKTMKMTFEEFEIVPSRTLTAIQEKRLHRLYCCGDASGGAWSTLVALQKAGMIELGNRVQITEKGSHYCFHHGKDMSI